MIATVTSINYNLIPMSVKAILMYLARQKEINTRVSIQFGLYTPVNHDTDTDS